MTLILVICFMYKNNCYAVNLWIFKLKLHMDKSLAPYKIHKIHLLKRFMTSKTKAILHMCTRIWNKKIIVCAWWVAAVEFYRNFDLHSILNHWCVQHHLHHRWCNFSLEIFEHFLILFYAFLNADTIVKIFSHFCELFSYSNTEKINSLSCN